jgi:hypothetical protein
VTDVALVVRWIASDAPRVRATLAAALEIVVPAGHPVVIRGLRLEIVEDVPLHGGRAADRLEVDAADLRPGAVSTSEVHASVAARIVGLGWATVDADRVAAAWAGAHWAAAARDSLVGARALLGSAAAPGSASAEPGATVAIVLLEPDTEGRLAAALARHGEGPTALYIELPEAAAAGARTRVARLGVRVSAGPGPFGPGIAIAGSPAWGPTLVIVPVPGPK